jgi:hypothetical protein
MRTPLGRNEEPSYSEAVEDQAGAWRMTGKRWIGCLMLAAIPTTMFCFIAKESGVGFMLKDLAFTLAIIGYFCLAFHLSKPGRP